ncbi:MAG TPA: HD domain-containing phosphohydrolase [Acidimicrobiia bacterium]|nr:HD domain-containing phosphohydrolase [Acidimicrobiia bacterium]
MSFDGELFEERHRPRGDVASLPSRTLGLDPAGLGPGVPVATTDPAASTALFALWEHLDEGTRGHLARVGRLARDLAGHIGLSAKEQAESGLAGLLHDIGKLGIPDAIVAKAAPLNLLETRLMHSHPERGALWLGGGVGAEVLNAIWHHHERMDGRGYPDGILAGKLSSVCRLVAVADTYDAITSDRPYRAGRSPHEAFRELRSVAGLQLDPELVEALIDLEQRALAARAA